MAAAPSSTCSGLETSAALILFTGTLRSSASTEPTAKTAATMAAERSPLDMLLVGGGG